MGLDCVQSLVSYVCFFSRKKDQFSIRLYCIKYKFVCKEKGLKDRSPLTYTKKLKAYKIYQIFSPNNSGWIVACFLISHDRPKMQFSAG